MFETITDLFLPSSVPSVRPAHPCSDQKSENQRSKKNVICMIFWLKYPFRTKEINYFSDCLPWMLPCNCNCLIIIENFVIRRIFLDNRYCYLNSASWSSTVHLFIISRNWIKVLKPNIISQNKYKVFNMVLLKPSSGNSIVPFPSRSTCMTRLLSSSSVGFCPKALITYSSSFELIAPLPSFGKRKCFLCKKSKSKTNN